MPWEPSLAGKKGWLAFLMLPVTLSPLMLAAQCAGVVSDIIKPGVWGALTTPGSRSYQAAWANVVTAEIVADTWLVALAAYVAYAYWTTRRSFPALFVVLAISSATVQIGDAALVDAMFPKVQEESGAGKAGGGSVGIGRWIVSLLWVGYVMQSKRVKATFLPPPDEAGSPRRRRKRRVEESARTTAAETSTTS